MQKFLLLSGMLLLFVFQGFSQSDVAWSANVENRSNIVTDKAVTRQSFPKDFRLFNLNLNSLKQSLLSIVGNTAKSYSAIIQLPNVDGDLETFEVFEASNFTPSLQAKFPEIRAFSGKGITDKAATLKLSISPQGIQTMIFRTDKENEFIEPYSRDHSIYAVYKSHREKGQLPWTCSTEDKNIAQEISSKIININSPTSSLGELKTMRLAQSCNGEYSNYFGAFNSSQVALVLAAYNATLTRCNGCYENDLALHLNLIPETVNVIFYDPATDPYTTMGQWNNQLQATLTSIIGEANYDIGHMFGASGGGGNAGCIGCVCVDGQKGRGITSPADGIPMGDNFDIDYVAHEIGHQLGGNHTFSMSLEGTGVNKEVGSGITIMGYAGITAQDVAPHSIDIFHEATIAQIQANLAIKTCPITTIITATNATPVISPVSNYTIPISTPFALAGSATDANAGDVLTYCWEQNDNSTTTGNNSVAFPTKLTGPNWLSFPATVSGTRLMPRLSTILAGLFITPVLPGGDAIANIEALSSVSRALNFRLTVRDNCPYVPVSPGPGKIGQTAFTDMTVTVTNTSGPFMVTSPNTNVSWAGGSTQTITWAVANTTVAPVSCANVKISYSTDGGLSFTTVLVASTPNDGSEPLTIPAGTTTTARIKIESVGNIFFDISNTNFTVTVPPISFDFSSPAGATAACPAPATVDITLGTTSTGGFNTAITLSAIAGVPAGTTITFSTNPVTPGNSTIVTLNNANTLSNGTYNVTIQGVAGAITQTRIISYTINAGAAPVITLQPANSTVCAGTNATFTTTVTGGLSYQWQLSTDGGGTWNNIIGAIASSYTVTSPTVAQNNYRYRVIITGQCNMVTSAGGTLTVNTAPAITAQPQNITVCAGTTATFNSTATGSGLTYQWQLSIDNGVTYNNILTAIGASYTTPSATNGMNGYRYRVIVSGSCPSAATSTGAILTVGDAAFVTSQPTSTTICIGSNATFTVAATGTSLTYQWQVSMDGGATWANITGQTGTTLTLSSVTIGQNGNQYRAVVFSCTPTGINSTAATLTVNTPVSIGTQPTASTLCSGGNTGFTVAATGTSLNYQWQLSTTGCPGVWTNIANGGAYAGATTNALDITATTAAMNGYAYRVVITGACNTVTSNCTLLTVNSPVTISSQPVSSAICLPGTTSFSITAAGTATTYQWQLSTDGGANYANIAGANTTTYNPGTLTASMNGYQYRVILNGTCTSNLVSSVAILTVNLPVNITTQPVNIAICEGTNTSFTVAATGSTISYQWQVSINGGAFNNLTNGAPYSGVTTNTLTITNATTNLNGFVFRVIVSGVPCGAVTSATAALTVNQLPVAVLTLASYSSITPYVRAGLYATVSPTGTYSYQWFRNNVLVPGLTSARFDVTVDELGEYYVIVKNDLTGCTSTTNRATIKDSASNLVFIYPSPSTGQFLVRYFNAGSTSTTYSLNVYDTKGSRVYSKSYPIGRAYDRMDVNMKNAASGVYMVEVKDSKGTRLATGRVVIKH